MAVDVGGGVGDQIQSYEMGRERLDRTRPDAQTKTRMARIYYQQNICSLFLMRVCSFDSDRDDNRVSCHSPNTTNELNAQCPAKSSHTEGGTATTQQIYLLAVTACVYMHGDQRNIAHCPDRKYLVLI